MRIRRKSFVSSLVIMLALVFVLLAVPGAASAHSSAARQSHRPVQIQLYNNSLDWNDGTNYGMRTNFGTSNPAVTDGDCDTYFHRYVGLSDQSSGESDGGELIIGLQKTPANCADPYCNITRSTQWLSFFAWGTTTDGYYTPRQCWDVPTGLINQDVQYTLRGANGDGNGAYANFYSCAISPCYNVTYNFQRFYTHGFDPDYSDIIYNETYHEYSCSGHCIWGVNWYNNQWMDSSYNLHYHTGPSGNHTIRCSSVGCPLNSPPSAFTMYWIDGKYPADSGSQGGMMETCAYQSYGGYPWCTHNG